MGFLFFVALYLLLRWIMNRDFTKWMERMGQIKNEFGEWVDNPEGRNAKAI